MSLLRPAQRLPDHGQPVTDALGAVAVVAFQFVLHAGRLPVQAAGVERRGDVPRPPEGLVKGLGQLVAAHEIVDALMGTGGGGDAVAGAVDVDELAGLRQGVDAGEVDLGRGGVCQGLRAGGEPVPVDGAGPGKKRIQLHGLGGHAAADADGLAGTFRREPPGGVLAGGEAVAVEAGAGEGLLCAVKVHGEMPPVLGGVRWWCPGPPGCCRCRFLQTR